jgi:methylated-DNA-[protein]-cysteine S-methyltransferase
MLATTIYYSEIESPLGSLFVQGDGESVTGLYLPQHKGWSGLDDSWKRSDEPFREVRDQLADYFAGERQQFDLPIRPAGTPFQQQVWEALTQIPFGATMTYSELAERVGKPFASRAVGAANGRNPISIIVPCHRVIGANGKLTGYAGGVERKKWLLELERSVLQRPEAQGRPSLGLFPALQF